MKIDVNKTKTVMGLKAKMQAGILDCAKEQTNPFCI